MVSIEKCCDYDEGNVREALERTFCNLGGIDKYVKPGMKVVLKPNLIMGKHPDEAATTHPVLVQVISEMVGDIVRRKEGGKVIVAESPGGIYSQRRLKRVYSACMIDEAVRKTGAELNFDLADIEIDNPEGKYMKKVLVIKPLAEADLIINLPKLKSHGQMVYTGAVKNMFGAVPGIIKTEYHFRMPEYNRFANALIDIFLSVKPGLNIMDAVIGMEGNGPTGGNPRKIGAILAGEDAFEVDYAALRLVNAPPDCVPVIREAMERGLCPSSMDEIEIMGASIDAFSVKDFKMPHMDTLRTISFFDSSILRFITGKLKPKPVFIHSLCIGCAECCGSCPAHIIEMRNNKPYADLSRCIGCLCCQELCPAKAVSIKRPGIMNFFIKVSKKI